MVNLEGALTSAVRVGALVRYKVELEQGELEDRRLWLRPDVDVLLKSGVLERMQVDAVRSALRRFVVGGRFTVVTADCQHREVESIGDVRELKGHSPPFVELRFKPPKHDLRLFGRFVGKDSLVLTTHGMKSLTRKTGQRKLLVTEHQARCRGAFSAVGLRIEHVPSTIEVSISKARFL
jgi:hypothetical protein